MLLATGCSVSRFIPEGHYMLDKVSIKGDSLTIETEPLQGYIRQHPNSKWFNLVKVPMLPYMLSSTDSTKRFNRFLWRIGEAPVVEDSMQTERCRTDIEAAVRNLGYLNAEVEVKRKLHKNQVDVCYQIHPKKRYKVGQIELDIEDRGIDDLLDDHPEQTLLKQGMYFDMNQLDAERTRINNMALNNGYYRFNREFVRYEADTTEVPYETWLKLIVEPYQTISTTSQPHQRYRFGRVNFQFLNNYTHLRKGLLNRVNHIETGKLYNEDAVQKTYSALGALDAVSSTNIHITPDSIDSLILHTDILITPNKPLSISLLPEGTNSAGDLGAAVGLTFAHRNLFRGSEVLGLKLRGAFEAIKGLEGYDDANYLELSAEASLRFPDFIFPFLSRDFRRLCRATSELSIMYDSQDRPEFHRRVVTGAWRYRWTGLNSRLHHRIDLIDLNYVYMPWISETFRKDYLDNPTSRNAILRYNYENLFIMKWGYSLSFSNLAVGQTSSYGTNAYSIHVGAETAGNLLRAYSAIISQTPNDDGYRSLFGIAYAQYAKVDFDFSKSFRINSRNSLAMHFGLGIAVPYGNSSILPYEKRYFSGGANSVRGWSVRELGPGSFKGTDGRIDFINQTGDMKLDCNLEYRTHLFWKIDGAVFADAGNIWTLRDYADQPGGQFRFTTFWKQIAVAYGLGIRFNFNYFILRFDCGMKAINPAYEDANEHFAIIHPSMKRDFSFHFAVGLPF